MLNLTSCKKGENDPGLSLKSRTSRLTGEWEVDKEKTDYINTSSYDGSSNSSSGSTTINGNSLTIIDDGESSIGTINEYSVTFEKDGTFEIVLNYTLTESEDFFGDKRTTTTFITSKESGSWSFAGKDKDAEYKNKERVILNTTSRSDFNTTTSTYLGSTNSSTSTSNGAYSNGEITKIWVLDMLKNKEMKVVGEMNSSYSSNSGSYTYTSTVVGDTEMELIKK